MLGKKLDRGVGGQSQVMRKIKQQAQGVSSEGFGLALGMKLNLPSVIGWNTGDNSLLIF